MKRTFREELSWLAAEADAEACAVLAEARDAIRLSASDDPQAFERALGAGRTQALIACANDLGAALLREAGKSDDVFFEREPPPLADALRRVGGHVRPVAAASAFRLAETLEGPHSSGSSNLAALDYALGRYGPALRKWLVLIRKGRTPHLRAVAAACAVAAATQAGEIRRGFSIPASAVAGDAVAEPLFRLNRVSLAAAAGDAAALRHGLALLDETPLGPIPQSLVAAELRSLGGLRLLKP